MANRNIRNDHPQKVAIVGTYVPRRCGIAAFSADLRNALAGVAPDSEWWTVALNDRQERYDYPPEVRFEIGQKVLADYETAVDFLNMNMVDAVCLQHEFGIYGGNAGSYVLRLLRNLRMPVVTTLHTVLAEPSAEQRAVIEAIGALSDRLVVMSREARRILREAYGIPARRVAIIEHGVPDIPFLDTSFHKDRFGLVGRKVILTFGLLSRGKGIEHMIEALPTIAAAHPEAVFVVAGETHPEVRRNEGETYRLSLQQRARELGVDSHVVFYDQFLDTETLSALLTVADVCVTPYLGRDQIVSGVLSYGLGAGKAMVSTPYRYAEEVLAEGRGLTVPFNDPAALGEAVMDLLSNDDARNAMRKQAYTYGRSMVWPEIARRYQALFAEVARERSVQPRPYRAKTLQSAVLDLPAPRFDHLRVLTDGTGILQHARFSLPDRDHGYCTDDNARALIVAMLSRNVLRETDTLMPEAHRYLGFLQHAFSDDTGRFRNFMGYDRCWLEEVGSEDSHGRAVWALGQAILGSPSEGMTAAAMTLFEKALPAAVKLSALRASAYALLGIEACLRRFGGASEARRAQSEIAGRLLDRFAGTPADWPWPEDVATYANAVLPHALITSAMRLGRRDMLDAALRTLDWLVGVQTDPKGHFVPIGNAGWLARGGTPARFAQQPIEAQHMIDALLEAYAATGDRRWMEATRPCFEWFLGRNDLQQPLADQTTGGCHDGLEANGVNGNQGAESTLAWLHALIRLHMAVASTAGIERPKVEPIAARRRPAQEETAGVATSLAS